MSTSALRPVLVLGGYGAVGSVVTRTLADAGVPVRPAGRDLARAAQLADELGCGPAARVDVGDPDGFGRLLDEEGIGAVVLCVEPPDPTIARRCLDSGVHLVDVGATHALLAGVEALADRATAAGATAVLSVGLAPGVTNLLARRASDQLGGADRLDITVMLGGGERHGAEAVRWTVHQLARGDGRGPARRVRLPGHGLRTAHPFGFSDQWTLRRTLGVPEVTTRLCLDSRQLTAALFGMRRLGAFRVFRGPRAAGLLTGALGAVHTGGDDFAVRVDAARGDRTTSWALTGRKQSRVTGQVAALATRELLAGALPAGVHHLDQLVDVPGIGALVDDLPGTRLWAPAELDPAVPALVEAGR